MANASGVYVWTEVGEGAVADVVVAQPVRYSGTQPSLPLWHCCRFRSGHNHHAAGVWALVGHYTATFLSSAWRTTYAWDDTQDWIETGTWANSGAAGFRYTSSVHATRYLDFTVPAGHTGIVVLRTLTHSGNTTANEMLLELIDRATPNRSLKINGRGGIEWVPEGSTTTPKLTRLWNSETQLINEVGAAVNRPCRLEVARNIPPGDYRFRYKDIGPGGAGHYGYTGELQTYMVPDNVHIQPDDANAIPYCEEFWEASGVANPGPFMGSFYCDRLVEVLDHNGNWVGGTAHGHETQGMLSWTGDGAGITPTAAVQGPFNTVVFSAEETIKDQTNIHQLINHTQTRTFVGGKVKTVVDGTWRRTYTPGGCLVLGYAGASSQSFRPRHLKTPGDTKIGKLLVRAGNTSGTLWLETGHGVLATDEIFIDWGTGSREKADVGTAGTNNVTFSGGSGDFLPAEGSGVTAAAYVGVYPFTQNRAIYGITFADNADANNPLFDGDNYQDGDFDLPDCRGGFLADRRMVHYDDIEGSGERNVGRVLVLDWDIAAATGTGNSDIDQAANTEKMRTGISSNGEKNRGFYTYYLDGHRACAINDPFHAEFDMYFTEEGYFQKETDNYHYYPLISLGGGIDDG